MQVFVFEVSAFTYFGFDLGLPTGALGEAAFDLFLHRAGSGRDPSGRRAAARPGGATGEGQGQQKWVFQAVGPGDVNVKMWYGNLREAPLTGNPTYDFVAAVSDQTVHEKKTKKAPKKA